MKLIGMLDSPYVRRVAIALRLLDLPFEHDPLSLFRTFDEFSRINPVVKAPTLVCDDGTVLMDSGLVIEHLETLAGRSLWPADPAARVRALRVAGLALAACEKTLQIVYERNLRPPEKQHEPWMARVGGQLSAALSGLDAELARAPRTTIEAELGQAEILPAVAWRFLQIKLGDDAADAMGVPALAAYAAALERLPVFTATPADETVNATFAPR
jgi:glutathione S-transferase